MYNALLIEGDKDLSIVMQMNLKHVNYQVDTAFICQKAFGVSPQPLRQIGSILHIKRKKGADSQNRSHLLQVCGIILSMVCRPFDCHTDCFHKGLQEIKLYRYLQFEICIL